VKIIHIAQRYHEGFGYHENLLPRYQAALGHEVVLIASERRRRTLPGGQTVEPAAGEYMDGPVRIVRLPVRGEFKVRFVLFKGLENVLEGERPDYIYHHGVAYLSLLTAARYRRTHPSVFLAADNHADYANSARHIAWRLAYYRAFWTGLIGRYAGDIDLVFGVTPERCVFAEKEFGVPAAMIRFLPMGADVEAAEAPGAGPRGEDAAAWLARGRDGQRRRHDAPLRLVTGGKWRAGRGLEALVEAVRGHGAGIELGIFGSLCDKATRRLAAGAGSNMSFLGWQDRAGTMALLGNADLAVWPGQHTTIIEDAVAAGTPLIIRLYGSTSHIIRGNGTYLHSGDAGEIGRALTEAAGGRDAVEAMRERAAAMRDLLSYREVAAESLAYAGDPSPKALHAMFMKDDLCRVEAPGIFERRELN
jgi:glycosyltransferase involved in cell wall biosynthesis